MSSRSWLAGLVLAALATGCASAGEPEGGNPPFSYEGATGPGRWGSLSEEYRACDEGTEQSPIDLADAAVEPLPEMVLDYRTSDLEVVHTGHTVQANPEEGSGIELDGARYDLAQFHFHVPGEHAFDATSHAGELHYVHQDSEGNVAVVAVALAAGSPHPALDSILADLPEDGDEPVTLPGFALDAFLPGSDTTYRYSGSLTTPPCTEGVAWVVLTEPVEASTGQLDALADVLHDGHNNRPLQPRNDRDLLTDRQP